MSTRTTTNNSPAAIPPMTQERLLLAGFRLLRRDEAEGRFLIRYRDRGLFEIQGNDAWRTLASYGSEAERDDMLRQLIDEDFWSVEI